MEDQLTPLTAFAILDMRVGRIVRAEPNERARKPAHKLWIDFGPELGTKTSSAQIAPLYPADTLSGRLIICAVNLGARNIAGFISEVLTLGILDADGNIVLLQPEHDVPLGGKVF